MTLLALLACGLGLETDTSGDGPSDGVPDCDRVPPVSYDNFGEGFFARYCTSCHSTQLTGADRSGAPTGLNFDSEDTILSNLSTIRTSTLGKEPTMPPGGGPTPTELSLLDEWLTCSAS